MGTYTTKEGLEKLKKELEYLKTSKRKEISERLKRAISHGDLSENFDYSDAKEQQVMLEAKIRELEDQIQDAVIVTEAGNSDEIQIGSTARVEVAGDSMSFTIVTVQEADPLLGKISAESPIGAALLGKKKGETAEIETPEGATVCKILNIE